MNASEVYEGEFLWIDPALHPIARFEQGFVLHVLDLLGWADREADIIYVRGRVLDPDTGEQAQDNLLVLPVPQGQRRARITGPAPGAVSSPPDRDDPPIYRGVASVHRPERAWADLIGPPPGYGRVC